MGIILQYFQIPNKTEECIHFTIYYGVNFKKKPSGVAINSKCCQVGTSRNFYFFFNFLCTFLNVEEKLEQPVEETKLFTQQRFLLISILYIFFCHSVKNNHKVTRNCHRIRRSAILKIFWRFLLKLSSFYRSSSKLC